MKPSKVRRVLFVCVENSCRSVMAEAWFNALVNPEVARAESAGTEPAPEMNPLAVRVMREVGIEVGEKKPRLLTQELIEKSDLIVTMGCLKGCPLTPREKTIEWDIPDPKGKGIDTFREVRELIKKRVMELISEISE